MPTSKLQSKPRTRPTTSRKFIGRRVIASAYAVMACKAQRTHWEQKTNFDLDSFDIGIDNRCSGCISGDPADFIGSLRDSDRTIKGFMGT